MKQVHKLRLVVITCMKQVHTVLYEKGVYRDHLVLVLRAAGGGDGHHGSHRLSFRGF